MRRILFLPLAIASLAGCAAPLSTAASVATSGPVILADRTTLDETAASGPELVYAVGAALAELAVDTGRLKGANASRARVLNRQARTAILAIRDAYRGINSSGLTSAKADLDRAVAGIKTLVASNKGN